MNPLIEQLYHSFNTRDLPAVLAHMHPNVHWPNGWEGGYVDGPEAVKAYWLRQWQALNPRVTPVRTEDLPDGRVKVTVHQVVKDLEGNLVHDGMVTHMYTFDKGLITQMDIED
jgi:hypothetical protein